MTTAPAPHHLGLLEPDLAAVPGEVSVWCGHLDHEPAYSRRPHHQHYAASTMKIAVMTAAYRLAEAGLLDLDANVHVHDDFSSVSGRGQFQMVESYDGDSLPWSRLGQLARLRWLIRRMIVCSSNLATNLVLEQTGYDAVAEAWRLAGAQHSTTPRGIEDYRARDAGMDNLVTAADLAAMLSALVAERIADPGACKEMLQILFAQEKTVDVVQGLPAGTRVAHKNGWVTGVRHSAAYVVPTDAKPYLLVTCVTADRDDDANCQVIRDVAAASWADRHHLARASARTA